MILPARCRRRETLILNVKTKYVIYETTIFVKKHWYLRAVSVYNFNFKLLYRLKVSLHIFRAKCFIKIQCYPDIRLSKNRILIRPVIKSSRPYIKASRISKDDSIFGLNSGWMWNHREIGCFDIRPASYRGTTVFINLNCLPRKMLGRNFRASPKCFQKDFPDFPFFLGPARRIRKWWWAATWSQCRKTFLICSLVQGRKKVCE